ncbi:MAG: AAA family ATPase [Caldilineaceae bacterium]
MPQLEIRLFGSPAITIAGALLEVDTRKAIALLAYLAVTHQRYTRDALAALLWPDYNQTEAKGALRRTLSVLNKGLGGDWLAVDRESIELLRRPDVWIDIQTFHQQLAQCRQHGHAENEVCARCLPLLHGATELYRGDFMAGFTLRDSPNFDDWQFFQSESLRLTFGHVLERLVQGHTRQQAFDQAIEFARRWLMLDPLHEPAHRMLMQLYAWNNQRSAALRQYRECVRILDEELGVPPLAETTALYQAINENRVQKPPTATAKGEASEHAAPKTPDGNGGAQPAPQIRLVGRTAEWQTLLQAYQGISSNGQLIALEGEGGIGKTRLADAFVEQARRRDAPIIVARCYAGEMTLAYSPIIQGMRAALAQKESAQRLDSLPTHWLVETTRLLPELAELRPGLPPAPPLDSAGAQNRFFEGVSQVIFTLLQGAAPGILYLDDLHWADSATVQILSYLTRRLAGHRICLLLTWRSEEVNRKHPLRQLVNEAQRAQAATLLTLTRLDKDAIEELLHTLPLPAGVAQETLAERLYQESEGLPFIAVEYLDLLANEDAPSPTGAWQLPVGVRDLLYSRVTSVSDAAGQILNTAAVIGRSFDFDTVREASGRSEDECVAALEELLGRSLIQEVNEQRNSAALIYDFCHDKLREVVYAETSLPRRRLLHRRVAEALIGHARRRGQDGGEIASPLAHHYALAGQTQEAAKYDFLAGERAQMLFANREALAHFQAALAHGYPALVAVHTALGDLHTLLGEYNHARQSYESAAALAGANEISALEHKLGRIYHRLGLWHSAESHYQAALAALAQEDGDKGAASQRAQLFADRSLTAHQQGQPQQAEALAQTALGFAQTAGDQLALAQVHNLLGILARHTNAYEQAAFHLERSVGIAEQLNQPAVHVAAINNLALLYSANGQHSRAIDLLEKALTLCIRRGDRHHQAALHNNLADLYHATGQPQPSMAHLKEAVVIFAEIGGEVGGENADIWKLTEW